MLCQTILFFRHTRSCRLYKADGKQLARDLGLSDAEEQIPGKPWNYQQKFDSKLFFKGVEWSSSVFALPRGVCDM